MRRHYGSHEALRGDCPRASARKSLFYSPEPFEPKWVRRMSSADSLGRGHRDRRSYLPLPRFPLNYPHSLRHGLRPVGRGALSHSTPFHPTTAPHKTLLTFSYIQSKAILAKVIIYDLLDLTLFILKRPPNRQTRILFSTVSLTGGLAGPEARDFI